MKNLRRSKWKDILADIGQAVMLILIIIPWLCIIAIIGLLVEF